MKIFLTIIIALCYIQTSIAQACGVYELKYIGSIEYDSKTELKIRLPTTFFFHTSDKKNKMPSSYNYKLTGSKIESTIISHLTSVYTSDQLIKLYKSNRDFIPVLITALDSIGCKKRFTKKIPINKLKFIGNDNSGELTKISIDLGKIKI